MYEVGDVAARRWGDPDRARRLCLLVLTSCGDRLLRTDAQPAEAAVQVAATEGLSVYDVAYLAAARQHGHLLVSGDVADLVGNGLAVAPGAGPV